MAMTGMHLIEVCILQFLRRYSLGNYSKGVLFKGMSRFCYYEFLQEETLTKRVISL